MTLERPDLVRHLMIVHKPRKARSEPGKGRAAAQAAPSLKYEAAPSVAYGAGLRVSEVASLKVSDIPDQVREPVSA